MQAKPLLQQGSIEKLLDPRIKFTERNLDQIARMMQAADACKTNEESKRANIDNVQMPADQLILHLLADIVIPCLSVNC